MKTEEEKPPKEEVQEKRSFKETVRGMRRVYGSILGMAWSVARARSVGLATCMTLLGLAGAAGGLLMKFVIDHLAAGRLADASSWAVVYLIAVATTQMVNEILNLLMFDLGDRVIQEVDRRIMAIVAGVPGLDHLERSEFADKVKLVREQSWVPFTALTNVNALAYVAFGLVAALVLLGSIHPLLLLMPVVAIPTSLIQFRVMRKHFEKFDETAPEDRLAFHYMQLLTQPESAKEVRVFGLGNHLVRRHREITEGYIKKLFRDRLKRSAVGVFSGSLYGLALAGSIGFIGYLALTCSGDVGGICAGAVTIGDVAMGVMVARMVIGHVEMASTMFAWLAELSLVGERYLWMLDYEPEVKIRDEVYDAPEMIVRGITLENVGFVYPGTDKRVLEDVNLFIPAASTVALVGENGAGKSTIVKLLCRFYDPSEGRILVDGIDLKDLNLEEWRRLTGVAFQDFVRYQLVAREAVGVGDLPVIEDLETVAATSRFVGADRVIERLPDKYESQLGKDFEGGTELSEGEWQMVALARGAMRSMPALVILDEPTASLDARAEHEVFEKFSDLAGGRGGSRPVTLLVSHRFSTVRMADQIVVLHDGRIEELGSHDELLAAGGRYAELFRLQASRYD